MVAEAEVVTARLGERKEGAESVVRVGVDRSKKYCIRLLTEGLDGQGGRDRAAISLLFEDFFPPVPVKGEYGTPPAWGGIGEARNQCGLKYYGKLGGGRPKDLSFLRAYVHCAAR